MPARNSEKAIRLPLERLDYGLLGARGLALVAGFALVYGQARNGSQSEVLRATLHLFVAYGVLLYAAGGPLLRTRARRLFYLAAALLDLPFLVAFLLLSDGLRGPFAMAVPLWTACYALYFGPRGGWAAGAVALGIVVAIEGQELWASGLLSTLACLGSIAVHGPGVGYLSRLLDVDGGSGQPRVEVDVKHQREWQARLLEQEVRASVTVLAAGVVHEINNPLGGILACARALEQGQVVEERQPEYLASILEGVERIRGTVQGLQDYSRGRPAIPRRVDASRMIRSAMRILAPLAEERRVRIESSVPEDELWVRADAPQITKAYLNVIKNAVQVSPPGSAVTVEAERIGEMWEVRIRDAGPGIPEENRSKVLEPFFTTKAEGEGSGLGLSVTLGVMRSHGGELAIDSSPGGGCVFTLGLPAAEEESDA